MQIKICFCQGYNTSRYFNKICTNLTKLKFNTCLRPSFTALFEEAFIDYWLKSIFTQSVVDVISSQTGFEFHAGS